MKTNSFSILSLLVLAVAMGMGSCSEQRIEANSYESPNQFMMDNRAEEQVFVIDTGGQGGPIVGNQGTRLWGDSSIFMFPDGGAVAYPFTIKLIELYTPKDMILYAMPTVAQGNLLVTGGEIRVRAFKDDVELVLRPDRNYFALFPTADPDPAMRLFGGQQMGDIVDWVQLSDTDFTIVQDSAGTFYGAIVPQMGWINCDYFYGSDPDSLTTITYTSENDELDNVAKFLYFDDIQSVMQVYGTTSGSVPIGASVKSICFAMNASGNMAYHYAAFNVSANHVVDVTMEEISEADLLALLEGLL